MSNSLCRVRLFANHYFARFPVCAHSDRAHAGIFFSILIPPSLICGYYLQTRSGAVFSPYELANVLPARVFCLEPIRPLFSAAKFVQAAAANEFQRFLDGVGDSEGVELGSRPPSPLSECSESDESDTGDVPCTNPQTTPSLVCGTSSRSPKFSGPPAARGTVEKKRKAFASKIRRARRRRKDSPAIKALEYAPKLPGRLAPRPSHAVTLDAEDLPKSQSGSWVGLRQEGLRDTPWPLDELLQRSFTLDEWDGQ